MSRVAPPAAYNARCHFSSAVTRYRGKVPRAKSVADPNILIHWRQCISAVDIYHKCTQLTICLLYGKKRLSGKKILSQQGEGRPHRLPGLGYDTVRHEVRTTDNFCPTGKVPVKKYSVRMCAVSSLCPVYLRRPTTLLLSVPFTRTELAKRAFRCSAPSVWTTTFIHYQQQLSGDLQISAKNLLFPVIVRL